MMSLIKSQIWLVCYLITYISFVILYDVSATDDDEIFFKCRSKSNKSCSECMIVHPDCVWLNEMNIGYLDRCTIKSKLAEDINKKVIVGSTSRLEFVENEDYRLPSNKDEPAIQIRPQKLKLYLRHKKKLKFQIKYKALPNYPLDIYYLLDQTYTMGKHREYLIKLGDELAKTLESLTENYQIAFGYFSDKVAMPYYAMAEKILANPCMVIDGVGECAPGSNFVHSLNFTKNTTRFIEQVEKFKYTANMDDLEGGLDALMQIIMCEQEFGWRTHTRKIIVMATDGYIHTAGDGVLGGVAKRMPTFKCAMKYKHGKWVYDGLQYDYPSIEEIYRRLKEKKIALLLAIQEKEKDQGRNFDYYNQLNDLMHEVSYLEMLQDQPENIVKMVEAGYMDVVKKVQFEIKDAPTYLQFETNVYCEPEIKNTSLDCWNITLNKEYAFNIEVELTEIPRSRRRDVIIIEEMHIHEKIEIEVVYPEFCECERVDSNENGIKMNGTYECGLLKCKPGWVGDSCNKKCNRTMARFSNETYTSPTCSNNGDFDESSCKCICDRNFIGDYCEYPQCPSNNRGKICSGNGECDRGICNCYEGFTSEICNCTTSTVTCKAPGQDEECNLNGECICGECRCKTEYFGRYCEQCKDCHSCKYNDVLGRHILKELNDSDSDMFTFEEKSDGYVEFQCRLEIVENDASCSLRYKFDVNDTIKIVFNKQCSTSDASNFYKAGGGILFAVLLALLLPLFIWKLVVFCKDKREFAKFESNVSGAQFEQNNLYLSPITHYTNPTKGSSSPAINRRGKT